MRILHFSTFERGGAGIATGRLHRGLRELGHTSTMIVRDGSRTTPGVVLFEDRGRLLSDPLLDRFLHTALKGGRAPGVDYYFSTDRSTRDFTSLDVVRQADVIHLHWIAETVSSPAVRALQDLGKPVVWTLHDQFPFTGGCHYSGACEQYTTGCEACPHLRPDVRRIPQLVMRQKREWLDPSRLTVVAPSQWLAGCARRSLLFGAADVRVIPNSLPVGDYQRLTPEQARARLGWPAHATILLFGADSLGEQRKGFAYLTRALERLAADPSFARRLGSGEVVCATFGESQHGHVDSPLPTLRLGRLTSDEQLAAAYAAADMFVLPTLEDNLPNTLLESIAAGTPVVAYATGGVPDVLHDGRTGIRVPVGDVTALARAIGALVDDPARRRAMRETCRAYAREHLDLPVQGRRYLEIYGERLARTTSRLGVKSALVPARFARAEQKLLSGLLEDRALVAAPFKALQDEIERQRQAMAAEDRTSRAAPRRPAPGAVNAEAVRAHLSDLDARLATLSSLDADLSAHTAGSATHLSRTTAGTRDPLEWLLRVQAGRPPAPALDGPGEAGMVSVIVPVYNGERYLEEAVRSVWAQTHPADRVELLVADDGSTDRSLELATSLARRSPIAMRVLRHPSGENRGVSASRNLALAHARGEFIAPLDADDVYEPDRLAAGLRYMARHRDCDTLCSYGVYVNARGRRIDGPNGTPVAGDYRSLSDRIRPPFTFAHLWELYPIANSSLLIRRRALAEVGGYPEEMAHQAEDRLVVLKLSFRRPVHLLRRRLIRYRHHGGNFTTQYVQHGFEAGVQLELLYHLVHWAVVQAPEWRERGLALFRRYYPVLLAKASRPRPAAAAGKATTPDGAAPLETCVCNRTGMDAQAFLATRQRELAELDLLRRTVPDALRDLRDADAEIDRLRDELRRLRTAEPRRAKSA